MVAVLTGLIAGGGGGRKKLQPPVDFKATTAAETFTLVKSVAQSHVILTQGVHDTRVLNTRTKPNAFIGEPLQVCAWVGAYYFSLLPCSSYTSTIQSCSSYRIDLYVHTCDTSGRSFGDVPGSTESTARSHDQPNEPPFALH